MKKNIHPPYGYVLFRDVAAGHTLLTRSPATSSTTMEWEDGNTYPVIDVDVSAASHPFWMGRQKLLDTAGRVEKFRRRYARTEGHS